MPTVSKTAEEAAQQITRDDYQWGTTLGQPVGPITYGFRESTPSYSNSHGVQTTFSQFSTSQIDNATLAIQLWSDVANITFQRVGEGNAGPEAYTDDATILFANYASNNDASAAFAYYPHASRTAANHPQGDVWVNQYYDQSLYLPPSYRLMAIEHELGHALGLQHPGDYNAAPGVSITYSNSAEYIEDSRQYTIMSYFSATNTGANHGQLYAVTPLMHDVVALQRLYGVNMTTRTDDTIYGFNSNADRSVFQLNSAADHPIFCIWDAGGVDTLDLSGFRQDQVLDLRAGTFSDAGSLTRNISIAPGAIIENAIAGPGDDRVTGNEVSNSLYGRGGNDILRGGGGDDLLYGGRGKDKFTGGDGADQFLFASIQQSYNAADVISDFNPAEGDVIGLASIDANNRARGDQSFDFIGGHRFTHHAGELRYARGLVLGDVNGDGRADLRIAIHVDANNDGVADLRRPFHLSADDFIL